MAKRLFVGLELPAAYRELLAGLDPHLKGLRWLPAHSLHLTMSFLGSVPEENEGRLRESLQQVNISPFHLPLRGMGSFGGKFPKVVWAGVGKGHPHLFALHKHIQDAVLAAGLEPDLKPFHPHVTLGRAKGVSSATLHPFLREWADAEFGMWKVTAFTLFTSSVGGPEPLYTALWQKELG